MVTPEVHNSIKRMEQFEAALEAVLTTGEEPDRIPERRLVANAVSLQAPPRYHDHSRALRTVTALVTVPLPDFAITRKMATNAAVNGSPRLKPGDFNLKQHPKPLSEVPNV